jgi:hypothetical protein
LNVLTLVSHGAETVTFDLDRFPLLPDQLEIENEQGLRRMDKLLGTQTYVMNEIAKGLGG